MKRMTLFLPALALVVLVGCQETPEGKKAQKEIKEASDATVKALQVQKDEYKKMLEENLDSLNDKLKEYQEKASKAGEDAKAKMQEHVDSLKEQRDKLKEKLSDLGGDSADAWEEIKKGLDKSWTELKEAFDNAKKHFDE